jgi:hypothetical protein
MKSMFRTLVLSATSLLFAVSSGHAVCYHSALKLEKDKKEKTSIRFWLMASASKRNNAPVSENGSAK